MVDIRNKTKYHLLMVFLIIVWGIEFAVAKDALALFDTVTLLWIKYGIGAVTVALPH